MIYVLGFPDFGDEVTAALARFRARHEPARAAMVGPHVTLVFGQVEAAAGARLADWTRVLAETAQIDLEFVQSVLEHDPHEDTHKIMLVCGRGREAVAALHRRLTARGADAGTAYRPHMTVATNRDRAALDSADPAEIGPYPIRGVLNRVAVVARDGARLRMLAEVRLPG